MDQDAPQPDVQQQQPPAEPEAAPMMSEEQAPSLTDPAQQAYPQEMQALHATAVQQESMYTMQPDVSAPSYLQPDMSGVMQQEAVEPVQQEAAAQQLLGLQAESELPSQAQTSAELRTDPQPETFVNASMAELQAMQREMQQQNAQEQAEQQSTDVMAGMQVDPVQQQQMQPELFDQADQYQQQQPPMAETEAVADVAAQALSEEQSLPQETAQMVPMAQDQNPAEPNQNQMMPADQLQAMMAENIGDVHEAEPAMQGEDTTDTQNNTHTDMDNTGDAMNVDEAEDEDIDLAPAQAQPQQIAVDQAPAQIANNEQAAPAPAPQEQIEQPAQEAMPEPMDTEEAEVAADAQPNPVSEPDRNGQAQEQQPPIEAGHEPVQQVQEAEAAPNAQSAQSASSTSNVLPELEECRALLEEFMERQEAEPFNEPVDWQGLNLPEYPQIITRPMDLGTVAAKLAAGKYNSAEAFAVDVRLTFKNARTFNQPGSGIYVVADNLSMQFERRYARIQKQSSGKRRTLTGKDASTFEQRQRFTTMVQQLSAAELGGVVELLEARSPVALSAAPGNDDELEIEVYDIKGDVLKDLITHMEKTIDKRSKRRRKM